FDRSRAPHDLHSFPTRRSSDLVIGNTGDDMWWHGLYIAPDLDTVTYWLAGVADEARGWGIRRDTFTAQAALARLSDASWFQLGEDRKSTRLNSSHDQISYAVFC